MSFFKSTRTSQPQQPIGLDLSNPIAAKLGAVVLPIDGVTYTLAPKGVFEAFPKTSGSGIQTSIGLLGRGVGLSRGAALTTDALRLHSASNQTNTVWESLTTQGTWLAVCIRFGNNTNGNAPVFGNQDPNASPFDAWAITDRTGSGNLSFSCGAGGTFREVTQTGGFANNTPLTLVGRYNGSSLQGFRNGVSIGSTACSGSIAYPNVVTRGPSIGNFYNYTPQARSFNGHVFLAAVWPVALSDAEIASISTNPWQLFTANRQPILLPLVSGVTIYLPNSDIVVNSWVATPGGTLASCIDESAADDADFITSPDLTQPATLGLSASMAAGNYTVRVRAAYVGAVGQVRIRFLDSSNVDVGGSGWQTLTGTASTYSLSVTLTGTADRFRIEVQ